METNRAKKVATDAALRAGKLIKERVGQIRTLDYKGAFNIVTDVDKAAEAIILEILKAEFPDDSVLAEEGGRTTRSERRRWLIDPLDGTTNFAHAYPFFCVSIALEEEGSVVLGVVYNPIADELFSAERGKGAWLNGQLTSVSGVENIAESLFATGFPPDSRHAESNNMQSFKNLTAQSHGVRRDGSAALDLCFVASGRLDGFWELKLAPWDIGAGSLIVEEAGGKVSDLTGGPLDIESGHILATNGLIHEQVIAVVSQRIPEKRSFKSDFTSDLPI